VPEGLDPAQRRNYLLLLATAGLYFCGISFLLLLPKFLKSVGASESELGWVIGTPLIAFVLLAPYAGYLADRFSAKRLALIGIAGAVLSGLGLMLVDSVSPLVYLLRLVHGAAHAFTFTPLFSMVAKNMSPEQKARGIAYFSMFYLLAATLALGIIAFFALESDRRRWLVGARAS
jgi:MFS family permease